MNGELRRAILSDAVTGATRFRVERANGESAFVEFKISLSNDWANYF